MQRKFIINLGLLLLLNFLIKPFWIFGIDRTVQNIVPSEDYGLYFALFNFSMLFNILLDVGITSFNNKNIAQHAHLLPKYFSGIVVLKFLLAVVYFTVTFLIGYLVGYDSLRFKMLFFLSFNQFLISFIQYLRSNITGLQMYTLDSVLSVLDKTIMILLCSILLWGNLSVTKFELIHFVYVQTWAYLVTLIIVFIIVLSKSKQFKFKLNKSFSLLIIKQTYPYALLVIAMMFYYRLDAIMLDAMLPDGEHQAAIYAQSYRLMDAFIQIPILFAGLLLPMFAYRIKDKKSINELLKLSFDFIFVISFTVTFIISFYSEEIIRLLYHSDIQSASSVLKVLMFGFISIALTNIFGTVLTANGSLKSLNIVAIGGVVINLVLNLFLIKKWGAYGAALASVITHFLVVVVQIFIVIRLFKIKFNLNYILSLVTFIVILILSTVGAKQIVTEPVLRVVLVLFVAMISSMALKIINLRAMLRVIIDRNSD